jgi:iron complex outermembrane receptor protein
MMASLTLRRTLGRTLQLAPPTAALLVFFALASPAIGQSTQTLPPPSVLKKMTVDELLNLEVTSVSKRPEKLFEAASAIQVATAEDIRRSGATSIPEALRLVSNLEVAQIDSRQWAITARGFNNAFADKMLVLIDGRTVYTPLYAGVYWDVQDTLLADLDRIEVISGPGATQWGANAVNGVINITTKSAEQTQGGFFSAGFGSELESTASLRYGGKLAPNVFYRVYAKYADRDNSVRSDGRSSSDAWRSDQEGFRVDWNAASDQTLTVQGDRYGGEAQQNAPGKIKMSGGNGLARWTHTLSPNSDVSLQAYYDRTHRSIPGSFTQGLDTYDLDFQHRFPVGSHDLVWGANYRIVDDSINNTPANAFLPPQVTHKWFGAFLQDEVPLVLDQLHLTVGTKVEHNDYTGYEIEPSIRLSWSVSKTQTLWSAVSRAVRTPSRIDRDLFSPAEPPYRIAGGPGVVSEKLIAYELGYRAQLDPGFTFGISTFYNQYDDLRSLEPLTPPLPFPVEISSGLRGHSVGAELTADWRVTPMWRLRSGYTELRVTSEPQPGTIDRVSNRSISLDPNHQAYVRSFWDVTSSIEADTTLRYVSAIGNQSLPAYTEMDLRLGWQPTATWELSIVGQNLLHNHHPEFNTPGSRREIQRSVYGKATWRF